ncbi:MAG: winged helix-turn-helix transcriptional regulator [Bacteroidetes bacterium]|nr:winged helix-turn-helix transcriptional regulator [Bacteroidota bacterium]
MQNNCELPFGTNLLVMSKLYYGVISLHLEKLDIDRYYSVLFFIYNSPKKCSQQAIADELRIDKTAMVKVIDYLSEKELVKRETDKIDRRKHFIILTKKGKKYATDIASVFQNLDKSIFKNINMKQKKDLSDVLNTVKKNLMKQPSNAVVFKYKKFTK